MVIIRIAFNITYPGVLTLIVSLILFSMEDNDPEEGDERGVAGDGKIVDPKDDAGEEDVDEDSNEVTGESRMGDRGDLEARVRRP